MSASTRLLRALEASARRAGCPVRIAAASERPWSSATFVGARHAIRLEATESPALATWLDGLADGFVLPGHVVADVAAVRVRDGVEVTALTLEA